MNEFLRKCWKYFAAAGVISCFTNILYLTFSLYMLAVYDRVLAEYRMSTLWIMTFIALLALTCLGVLEFIRSRILVKVSVKMDELLSKKVLKSMLADLALADTDNYNQGLKDIQVLRNYLSGNSIFAFFDLPWIFIYLWIIYIVHPLLGLTASIGGLVILALGIIQSFVTKKDMENQNKNKTISNDLFQRSLKSSHLITSMGMIKNSFNYFKKYNAKDLEHNHNFTKKNQTLLAISVSFRSMMQVIIFGVGAALVITNEAEAGVIIASSIIMGRALAPIDQVIAAWKQTSSFLTAYKNLDLVLKNYNPGKNIDPKELNGILKVEKASLNLSMQKILEDISFDVKPGEILGLAGHNGAGKTCLSRMLLGMWTPSSGKVTLNNIETAKVNQDILGENIGYLPQNVELFTGTVEENIARLGEKNSLAVLKAAEVSGAHEVIIKLPKGYNTYINENGMNLSGGQRQRVGLARALYKDPGFIILDEPDSNLDQDGDKALVEALKHIRASNAVTIIITHKPDLLYQTDKILVLEQGRVKMYGTRDEVFSEMVKP